VIAHQPALLRRELWEHPAIWVAPVVTAIIVCLLTLTGQVSISAFGEVIDLAIVGAQNVDAAHRTVVLNGMLLIVSGIFAVGAWVIMAFYSLDALYGERKDKSILFWRSLPITDAESIISKLLTALLVIPLVSLAVAIATHVLVLVITGAWIKLQGGAALHLIWEPLRLFDVWLACVIMTVTLPLWQAPLIGWFLFVSTFAKRSPFLTGVLPILVVPLLERLLVGTHLFWDAIFVRTFQPPILDLQQYEWLQSADVPADLDLALSPLRSIDLPQFLSSPSLWAGLIVCALFTAAAIYVRRYRDESY
jgi:ABC-2 type transport system permease protein